MHQYRSLLRAVRAMEQDFHKCFVKGQKKAATRLRKDLMEMKHQITDLRAEALEAGRRPKIDPPAAERRVQ